MRDSASVFFNLFSTLTLDLELCAVLLGIANSLLAGRVYSENFLLSHLLLIFYFHSHKITDT